MNKLKLTVIRDDTIPAYGAWHRCSCNKNGCHGDTILLNLEAAFGECVYEDGTPVDATNEEKKRVMIETLMHEFGHALEAWFGLPDNEDALEKAIKSFNDNEG